MGHLSDLAARRLSSKLSKVPNFKMPRTPKAMKFPSLAAVRRLSSQTPKIPKGMMKKSPSFASKGVPRQLSSNTRPIEPKKPKQPMVKPPGAAPPKLPQYPKVNVPMVKIPGVTPPKGPPRFPKVKKPFSKPDKKQKR